MSLAASCDFICMFLRHFQMTGVCQMEGHWVYACAGLQYVLPATWTAVKRLDPSATDDSKLMQLSRWWSSNPSQIAGIGSRKGQIAKGFDADFVVKHFFHLVYCSSCHSVCPCCQLAMHPPGHHVCNWCTGIHFWSVMCAACLMLLPAQDIVICTCTHIGAVRLVHQCACAVQ